MDSSENIRGHRESTCDCCLFTSESRRNSRPICASIIGESFQHRLGLYKFSGLWFVVKTEVNSSICIWAWNASRKTGGS